MLYIHVVFPFLLLLNYGWSSHWSIFTLYSAVHSNSIITQRTFRLAEYKTLHFGFSYTYYCYYSIWLSLVTGIFFSVLLLNQQWSPPLRLQASHCSTFRIMCDVPSIAVFCSESIECFPGTASKFFLKLLVTIPVARVITGTIVHFRFHTRRISIHKLLYFKLFSASFCTTFLSAGIGTSISVHVFFLFLTIKLKLRGLGPHANYTDRAAAAGRRS